MPDSEYQTAVARYDRECDLIALISRSEREEPTRSGLEVLQRHCHEADRLRSIVQALRKKEG
jgi:hypothetical protein